MTTLANSFAGKDWAKTLSEMELTLEKALETIRQRQRALDDYFRSAASGNSAGASWPQSLEDSMQRAQHLATLAERAGGGVAEVDTALAEGEKSLKEWLAATEAAQRKLATWLAGAVR
jgi:hypothetical protein